MNFNLTEDEETYAKWECFKWGGKYVHQVNEANKRPLDSYACPDQNQRNRTNQQMFLQAKNIQNWCNFTGKRIACVNIFTFLAQKALFAPHLYTLQITYIEMSNTLYSA